MTVKLTALIPVRVEADQLVEQMNAFGIQFPPGRVPLLDERHNDIGQVVEVRPVSNELVEVVLELDDADVARALSKDALRGVSL